MDSNIDRISRGLASTTSRRQAFKMLGGGLLGGALAGAGFAAAKDTAAQGRPTTGTATGTGTGLDPEIPAVDLGTITGLVASLTETADGPAILVSGVSEVLGEVSGLLQLASSGANATCDVLNLDLLGLIVIIEAEPGPGNLLGNLLCAVAGLLDQGGPLQGIVGLLNNIFRGLA